MDNRWALIFCLVTQNSYDLEKPDDKMGGRSTINHFRYLTVHGKKDTSFILITLSRGALKNIETIAQSENIRDLTQVKGQLFYFMLVSPGEKRIIYGIDA
jgi:hypothetical protein